ncbi:hypothetical protein EJ06DRAFT_533271 [Trichodelitschia bisporula]|uniref:Uncharacterized protein n=1 Tax=Trichodelitschia bisporula TaxID=703511 RepID=A0A6G1HMF0_9PEZI|nr:hypothetical protein EJ06DRAFT_533271 [Trichodelitschia bisporula]
MSTPALLKSVLPPLFLALLLYLATAVLLPLYRRHRARYSQYLPVSTPGSGPFTNPLAAFGPPSYRESTSFTTRLTAPLILLLPASWAERWERRRRVETAEEEMGPPAGRTESEMGASDTDFDSELEDLVVPGRRDALSLDARPASAGRRREEVRRLSRELEEGFRDDSESEDGR